MNRNEFVGLCACVAVAGALYFSTQTKQQTVPEFAVNETVASLEEFVTTTVADSTASEELTAEVLNVITTASGAEEALQNVEATMESFQATAESLTDVVTEAGETAAETVETFVEDAVDNAVEATKTSLEEITTEAGEAVEATETMMDKAIDWTNENVQEGGETVDTFVTQ